MLLQPPAPLTSGFLFPRDSVLDALFDVSRRENPVPRMYLGYSGQGKTTAMQMAMAQFRREGGANFCVRACHVSFRDYASLQDADMFIKSFSNAIGGYDGTSSFVSIFPRLRIFAGSVLFSLSLGNRKG
jgi:hypothetical protein